MRCKLVFGAVLFCAATAPAATYDLKTDWSDSSNPNGVWTYREGTNALPHVASWQAVTGGWSTAQPGWAKSQDGTDRIPFIFKSNGSETFAHDFVTGDIVMHTRDDTNGFGNGEGNFLWTSPDSGTASINGSVWMGRDIGRANHWILAKNGTSLSEGDISSGDIYNRTSPFDLTTGSGGAAAVTNIPIAIGDQITLTFKNTTGSGDFVGTLMTIDTVVPEPMMLTMLLPAMLLWRRR